MKKTVFVWIMVLCLLMTLSACGRNASANEILPSSSAGAASASSSGSTSPSPAESSGPKIVFHDIIGDPQADYLTSLGGGVSKTTGTAELDLVLYETEPNVFEGSGIVTRSLEVYSEEAGLKQEYSYRTGLIRARADTEGSLTLTGWLIENRNTETVMSDAPFHLFIHKDGTLQQKNLPFLLTLNDTLASLSVRMNDHAEFIFSGKLTEDPAESPVGKPSDPENLIYINSLWSTSFSSGTDDGDYTAVLLASPHAGGYSGQLSIQGTGNVLEDISELVTFSFEPFDAAAYREAGGRLTDQFVSMSVLQAAGRTYILLLDGDRAVLEPKGEEVYFCGSMPSSSETVSLQNEAAKTRDMLSYLCRQKSGTEASIPDYSGLKDLNPNNPEDMQKLMDTSEELNAMLTHQESPAWYPDNLIPMVNFSIYDGFATLPPENDLLFRIYGTTYSEEENFEDLVEPYRAILSDYDDYKEFLDDDYANGVFLFTMGRYTVQVQLSQDVPKLTSVTVLIY